MNVVIPVAVSILVYVFALHAEDSKNTSSNATGPSPNVVASQLTTNKDASISSPSTDQKTNATEEILAKIPPDFSALGLRPELEEIIKMAQSGVSEEVIIQFINQSTNTYSNLTSQEIITLNDLGVPSTVIAAMMRKSGKSEQDIQKLTEERMVVSVTNETMTATREGAAMPQLSTQIPQATEPSGQVQVAQIQTQVYTQTVYVPVQTEQPQVVVQQQPVVLQEPMPQTVVVYYNYLSPYGSWLYIDGYGYCWQPTVAVINPWWRPYYHGGRWVWTDYGWYWLSDYSWGWAAFHYGRWHYHHRCGWVWVPDTVWAPAWVSWRVTPTYCGWAPLPPHAHYHAGIGFVYHGRHVDVHFDFGLSDWHYTFVSWHSFHHRDFHRGALPRDRVRPVYENSTVINNYIIGNNNNVVINTGVGTDHISRLTREEVKKVVVRDIPAQGAKPIYSERLVKDGNNIVLYRPSPQTPLVAKADAQPIRPSVAPIKYTVSEKPSASSAKLATPAAPATRLSSEPAKTISPVGTPVKADEKNIGKKIATPEKTLVPGQRQAIEPIKPSPGITKTPTVPSAPIRPEQPVNTTRFEDKKLTNPARTPEVAKAEIPKAASPISPAPTITSPATKDISPKDTTVSKPSGIKTQPILPNNGLTAGTYGSARQNPIVTPSIPNTYSPQMRLRSPSGSASGITPQNPPAAGREIQGPKEILPGRTSVTSERQIQPLSTPSAPQTPRSEFRAPTIHPVVPQPTPQSTRPITPSTGSRGATEIQPGGVRFTPLPTPSSPSPLSTPHSIAPPQAPTRSYSPPPTTRYEAPKQSIAPSSPVSPSRSYTPAPSSSSRGGVPSTPPSMPSSPSGFRGRSDESR